MEGKWRSLLPWDTNALRTSFPRAPSLLSPIEFCGSKVCSAPTSQSGHLVVPGCTRKASFQNYVYPLLFSCVLDSFRPAFASHSTEEGRGSLEFLESSETMSPCLPVCVSLGQTFTSLSHRVSSTKWGCNNIITQDCGDGVLMSDCTSSWHMASAPMMSFHWWLIVFLSGLR